MVSSLRGMFLLAMQAVYLGRPGSISRTPSSVTPPPSCSTRIHTHTYMQGASFGASRELQFLHEPSGKTFTFPQNNGDVFAFTSEVNQRFMHGVPRATSAKVNKTAVRPSPLTKKLSEAYEAIGQLQPQAPH